MVKQDPFLNRQIDEYKVEALLGLGGMARVYRGTDIHLMRPVAIKIIDYPYRDDPAYITRFEREAQVIAQLVHPNVIQVYRYGEKDGYLYMVMQYVDGSNLHAILSSYRSDVEFLEPGDVTRIVREACQALDYVHGRGVIHRDVKPSNILLNREGHVILSDFGLALITQVGTLGETFGSPQYMAPEQALSSARAGPGSDLYSVGVILFEIFTGQLPFQAHDSLELAMQHVTEPVPSPRGIREEITPEVEAVILKTLAKAPEDRYPSGAALASALEAAVQAKPLRLVVPPTLSHLTLPERVRLQAAASSLVHSTQLSEATPEQMPEERQAAETEQEIAQRRPEKPRRLGWSPVLAVAGVLGVMVAVAFCLGLLVLGGRLVSAGISGVARPDNRTPLAARTLPAVAGAPSPTQGKPLQATATMIPLISSEFDLRLVKSRDESLVLINESGSEFPLATLQLGNSPSRVNGEDWGIKTLKAGECTGVWKNGKKKELPKGLDCDLVGALLERSGPQRFWTTDFNLYYQDEFVGTCEQKQAECGFQFSASP